MAVCADPDVSVEEALRITDERKLKMRRLLGEERPR
jgi:hypothetical protein